MAATATATATPRVSASTRQPIARPGACTRSARLHALGDPRNLSHPADPAAAPQCPGRLSHRHGRERGERRPPGRAGQRGRRRPRRAQDHEGHGEDAEREGGVRCAREQLGPAGEEAPGPAAAASPAEWEGRPGRVGRRPRRLRLRELCGAWGEGVARPGLDCAAAAESRTSGPHFSQRSRALRGGRALAALVLWPGWVGGGGHCFTCLPIGEIWG